MEAVPTEDKSKQQASALPAPPPQPVRQLSQSEQPPPHALAPPRTPSGHWDRPSYHHYENAEPRVPPNTPYTGPPRDPSHMQQEIYSRSVSVSGPPRPPHETHFRSINGVSHEGAPLQQAPEFRSLQYAPGDPPNGEPHRNIQLMPPPEAVPVSHRQYTPGPGSYEPGGYFLNQSGYGGRRRNTRAQQACDQCRARKAKCDEGRPSCSHCKENNVHCVYKDVPPHKHERSTQVLLDKLQVIDSKVADHLGQMDDRLGKVDVRFEKIEDILKLMSAQGAKLDAIFSQKRDSPESSSAEPAPKRQKMMPSQPKGPELEPARAKPPVIDNVKNPVVDNIKKEADIVIDNKDDDEISISFEHTTAAHKLLSWPSIQKLIPEKIDNNYVMELEETRGPIRPYGWGEGEDKTANDAVYPHLSSPLLNSTTPPKHEIYPSTSNPSVDSGTGLEIYQPHSTKLPKEFQVGGLNSYGTLDLSYEAINKYYEGYVENMYILHPILGEPGLFHIMTNFAHTYSPSKRRFSFASLNDILHRSKRRKVSIDVGYGVESPSSDPGSGDCPPIHRTMDNAIALLILALGAICLWKKEIPGPIRTSPAHTPSPYSAPNMSPVQEWKYSQPYATGSPNGLRSMHVIPGMAYYALASDILGNLQGGNDLAHAQGCLLASLYTGQLAHPFASHAWICQASRACQALIRPQRYKNMPEGPRKELIEFAFWACVQLESDILAELDLADSGISRKAENLGFPNGTYAYSIRKELEAPDTLVHVYYTAQSHLRKSLNEVHASLYKAEKKNSNKPTWSIKVQETLSTNLEQWRETLPPTLKWDDSDPPAKDINIARMRAKYYGGRYIIHRPLLHHALHPSMSTATVESPAMSVVSSTQSQVSPSLTYVQANPMERWPTDMPPPSRSTWSQEPPSLTAKDMEPKLYQACVTCVEAAVNSTIAFDGVEGRPVVTNIFGTAHAQFGNILVLAATYTSHLSRLIDRDKLKHLIDRTINFLLQSRYISPTLCKDADILMQIRRTLFEQQTPAASFSSNDA